MTLAVTPVIVGVDVGGELVHGVVATVDGDDVAALADAERESTVRQRGPGCDRIGVVGRDGREVIDDQRMNTGGSAGLRTGGDQAGLR